MTNGQMIAVWGSGGSGKTTAAIKLASQLAQMNKDVIIVLTDVISPDINVVLPFAKDIPSMGGLWATPNCSIEAIYKSCIVTESDRICLLAYKTGENVFSNPDYTKENIMNIFMLLKGLADYVIVDCVSSFAYNVLSTVALEISDKVIRLGEATPKSFSFFNSNLPLLTDNRYKVGQHIKVLAKAKDFYAKDAAINFMGGISAELPYVEDIEYQMLTGELFLLEKDKEYKAFHAGLSKIIGLLENSMPEEKQVKSKQVARNGQKEQRERNKVDQDPKTRTKIFKLKKLEVS